MKCLSVFEQNVINNISLLLKLLQELKCKQKIFHSTCRENELKVCEFFKSSRKCVCVCVRQIFYCKEKGKGTPTLTILNLNKQSSHAFHQANHYPMGLFSKISHHSIQYIYTGFNILTLHSKHFSLLT